jgi:CheY-like chemotaxis protein
MGEVAPKMFPVLTVEDDADDILFIRRAFAKAKLANPLRFVENGEQAMDYLLRRGE